MSSSPYIDGTERVVDAWGYWPTFHDAEVISLSANRALSIEVGKTDAHLVIHVRRYKTVGEGTAEYQQVLEKSILVSLIFTGACEFELSGFNHQNVINSISVTPVENGAAPLRVDIEPIWGFGGSLFCSMVAVQSVEVLPNE